uniref:MIF4G domain-containing protein n=1 Tax=Anisakis simplex TaxID=6269 RepID=A0A0M3JW51_ANISI
LKTNDDSRMPNSGGTRSLQGSPRISKQQPQFVGQQISSTPNSPMINRRKFDRINQWNLEHQRLAHLKCGSSGAPSTRTSSVISAMSGISRVSNMSMMSALSISTEISDLPDMNQMVSIHCIEHSFSSVCVPYIRSAQYSSASSCASFAENIDPTYYLKVEQAVDELSGKMRLFAQNTEGMHANDSLRHVAERIYKLSREHDLSRIPYNKLRAYIINTMYLVKMGPDIEEVEQALLAAMYIFSTKPVTFRTLQEIFREHTDEVLAVFAQRLDHRCYYSNFAAITIHTLLVFAFDSKLRIGAATKTQLMNKFVQLLRAFVQLSVEHRLRERNKHIIIDTVRMLAHREDSIKV